MACVTGTHRDGSSCHHTACYSLGYNAGQRSEFKVRLHVLDRLDRSRALLRRVLFEQGRTLPPALREEIEKEVGDGDKP